MTVGPINSANSTFPLASANNAMQSTDIFNRFNGVDTAKLAEAMLGDAAGNLSSTLAQLSPVEQGQLLREIAKCSGLFGTDKGAPSLSPNLARLKARLFGINPDRPIFIGGGGDGYGTSIVQKYAKQQGYNFFIHSDRFRIQQAIEIQHSLGKPIVIVGHSWGGDMAFDAAKYAIDRGIKVDLLGTIDPVDSLHNHSAAEGQNIRNTLGGIWINVRSTSADGISYKQALKGAWDNGLNDDYIKVIGGPMRKDMQMQATYYRESPRTHMDFKEMLKDPGNIELHISRIYRGR